MSHTKLQSEDMPPAVQVKVCVCGNIWKEAEPEQNSFLRLQGGGDLADGLGSGVYRGIRG